MSNFFDDQWFHCFQITKCPTTSRKVTIATAGGVGNIGFHTIQTNDGGKGFGYSAIDPHDFRNNRLFFFEIKGGQTFFYATTSVAADPDVQGGHIITGKFRKFSGAGDMLANGEDWTSNRPTV